MTATSTATRAAMLDRLRQALAGPATPFRASRGHPQPSLPDVLMSVTEAAGGPRDLAAVFRTSLEVVLGSCEIVDRGADVAAHVVRQIERWRDDSEDSLLFDAALSWAPDQIPVPDLEPRLAASGIALVIPTDLHDEESRARSAGLSVGITGADAAFATTGSLALASGPGKSRVASLLPLHHLAVVPMSRIYPTFEAWLAELRREHRLPSFVRESGQLVFVTGPSKSADIELNLTLGVHGPKAVHVVVFDDGE